MAGLASLICPELRCIGPGTLREVDQGSMRQFHRRQCPFGWERVEDERPGDVCLSGEWSDAAWLHAREDILTIAANTG